MALVLYLMPLHTYKLMLAMAQALIFILALYLFIQEDVSHQSTMIHALGEYPVWLSIDLVADPISALFVLLTSFLFLMCTLYAYDKSILNKQFLLLFLVLQGLINGIFLVQDLFSLYALVEVSTVVVSILIMFNKDGRSIYDGIVYLLINMISMTFFLIGTGYIYKIFGTLNLLVLKTQISQIVSARSLILPYAFIITAVGLKSAVMPLFSWLPKAHGTHSAPYIVSAILSGLYIKSSLYIFIRVQAIFGSVLETHDLFILLGFLTAIIGTILALAQTDLKLLLAYSSVSQIGFMIFGLSLLNDYSYYGSIYHIISHAVFKSTLFLSVGILIDVYGSRDILGVKSVLKNYPYISLVMIIAMLGLTGAPLFNGSISKYLIQKGSYSSVLEYGLLFMNIATMTYMVHLSRIFIGPQTKRLPIHISQKVVVGILAIICSIGGLFGHKLVNLFFDIHIEWSLTDYFEKALLYIGSLLIAFLFYKHIYPKLKFIQTLHKIELSFNELVFSIILFFLGLLSYLMVTLV